MRRFCLLFCTALISTVAVAQSSVTDSQNLRALLDEVRQLRRDLQTTTVAAQRVQIVLYRLQLQDAALARAAKLVEEARGTLAALATEHAHFAASLEQGEEQRKRTQDAHERKVIEEEALPQVKRRLEQLANDEQQWQGKLNEAETQLKLEQAKSDSLRVLLDQLDQALQNVGRKSESLSPPR